MAPDRLINDPWRNLRRGPAWISFIGSFAVLAPSLPYVIQDATDNDPKTGGSGAVLWCIGAVLVLASIPFGFMLLRANDRGREVRLALITIALWLVGVLVLATGSAWGSS
ncbi:hypothetical protein [Dactylosporangium matsuzakiense]|uniref:Uncharacterized protein n=1 Tax=Dactylosporangium matsuzakiense TaxID=53360 RepID=A0A9W6NQH1_9ACTN|nr:hypothetical protein [Dactylosporangium matsuzakiense]GLL05112.1 hypothetical protein GCM10017581_068590 [Dactylosporangium matsuzakiense]